MKHKILIFLLLFSFGASLFALDEIAGKTQDSKAEVFEVDIETAVKSALESQVSIKTSEIELAQSERNYNHSWNKVLPSLNASVTGGESGLVTNSSENALTVKAGVNASLTFDFGLAAKIKALKAAYESGQKDYADTVRQIEYEVRKSFYALLYMQSQVESSEESLEEYKNQYEQMKEKKSRGLVPEIDLLNSQVNYESAKISLKNTQKSYVNALLEFLNETGIQVEHNQKVALKGSLDDCEEMMNFDFDAMQIESVLEKNSSVRALMDSLEQAKLSKDQLAASSFLPSLTFSAGINPYIYSYGLSSKTSTVSDSWSASLGLSFSLDNLIPGSAAKDSVKDLEDSIASLELQLAEKKQEIKTGIFEMLNEIEIAKETLENCKLNVELAKKTYDMALVAYKNGTKDISSLQTIQTSYTNAQLQLRNQQLTLIDNILELKNTIGE